MTVSNTFERLERVQKEPRWQAGMECTPIFMSRGKRRIGEGTHSLRIGGTWENTYDNLLPDG